LRILHLVYVANQLKVSSNETACCRLAELRLSIRGGISLLLARFLGSGDSLDSDSDSAAHVTDGESGKRKSVNDFKGRLGGFGSVMQASVLTNLGT
jgi:hypothetical protein